MQTQMRQRLTEQFLNYTKTALQASLLDEVYATPKPGLVDLHDSGAHTDMDFRTFEASTGAIVPFLTEMAAMGTSSSETEEHLFSAIRPVGIQAEAAMFEATKGVNTHKGMIFSMGLIAAAVGRNFSRQLSLHETLNSEMERSFSLQGEEILSLVKEMCAGPLEADFAAISHDAPRTHGEKLFVTYGCRGIRGEAARGFPAVSGLTLPRLRKEALRHDLSEPTCWNRVRLLILLELMSQVEDTNILYRTDYQSLLYAKKCASDILSADPSLTENGIGMMQELNRDFINRRISPGGCADLLAITLFLWRMERFIIYEKE